VLVLLAVIAGANRIIGQEKPASLPRPLYPLPGYEEDWSFLSGAPSCESEIFSGGGGSRTRNLLLKVAVLE
jgi:hypothetical protein